MNLHFWKIFLSKDYILIMKLLSFSFLFFLSLSSRQEQGNIFTSHQALLFILPFLLVIFFLILLLKFFNHLLKIQLLIFFFQKLFSLTRRLSFVCFLLPKLSTYTSNHVVVITKITIVIRYDRLMSQGHKSFVCNVSSP